MRIHLWSVAVAFAVFGAVGLAACVDKVPTPAVPDSAPSAAVVPAASADIDPAPTLPPAASTPSLVASAAEPELPAERMAAPLVLRLQGPDPVPAKGDIKLELEVVTREPFTVPVTLKIAMPKGATLASGKAEEVLRIPQAGTMHRAFVVRSAGALSGPVVVTADTKVDGKSGLHAERKYPDPGQNVSPAATAPKPPVPRPAAPPK